MSSLPQSVVDGDVEKVRDALTQLSTEDIDSHKISNFWKENPKMVRTFFKEENKQRFCERLSSEAEWETGENIQKITETLKKEEAAISYTKILNLEIQNVLSEGVLHRLVLDQDEQYILVQVREK